MAVKHLINFKDWSGQELQETLRLAIKVKQNQPEYWQALDHKTLGMIFPEDFDPDPGLL